MESSAAQEPNRWLCIVGIGEDGFEGLPATARTLIDHAELLVGGRRHLAMVPQTQAERMIWPSPLTEAVPVLLRWEGRRVVVLASGDPFFFGIGATLARYVPMQNILCLPQPSAFSLAAARLGWPLQECRLLSLHGRPLEMVGPHLQPGARLLALSWDDKTPGKLAQLLVERGFERSLLTVLERMGGADERSRTTSAQNFTMSEIDALNTLAVEIVASPNSRPMSLGFGLADDMFEHDGQLTKREIRAVTLSSLRPLAGQLLWDVGLGAGSVAIEWLLADQANRAIGIEARGERAARAAGNAARLGVPHLHIVKGAAPMALEGLEAPDAVFIGGGVSDSSVFETAWTALKLGGRLVVNAVTLETEARVLEWHRRFGGDIVRISLERADSSGKMNVWRPAMPVMQWCVEKRS